MVNFEIDLTKDEETAKLIIAESDGNNNNANNNNSSSGSSSSSSSSSSNGSAGKLVDPTELDYQIQKVSSPASASEEVTLHKSYYQRAFLGILESILEVYSPILTDAETALCAKVLNEVEFHPQRLLVRLFLRKPGWLRVAKLDYEDIADIPGCLKCLHRYGLIDLDSAELNDLVDLLTIPELKTLANRLGKSIPTSANRDSIIDAILTVPAKRQRRICFSATGQMSLTSSDSSSALEDALEQAKRLTGPVVQLRLEVRRTLDLAISLYFLVASDKSVIQESLSTAVLNEINRRKYPRYRIKRSGPIFPNRQEYEEYQEALEEEARVEEAGIIDDLRIESLMDKYKGAVQQSLRTTGRSYFLKRYSAGWVYCRILASIAGALETAREYARAVSIYQELLAQTEFCLGRRGRWWERIVLDTSRHLKAPQLALKLCQQALNDPLVRTAARTALQRRLKKFSSPLRQNGNQQADDESVVAESDCTSLQQDQTPPEVVTLHGRIRQGNSSERKVQLHLHDDDLELGSVESFVLAEFGRHGWQGIHCESSFFTTLFGLLFWDILFGVDEEAEEGANASIRSKLQLSQFEALNRVLSREVIEDVFQTAYQNAPLDLATDAFYPTRRSSIEARLRLIRDDFPTALLLLQWHHLHHHQQCCVGVDWETFGGEEGIGLLLRVCKLIGPEVLSLILRQFAEDYRHHRSGMPDLLLWPREEELAATSTTLQEDPLISDFKGGVLFAEVKSPNDRMSDAQRYWFSVLQSAGMRVVLIQVREKPVPVPERTT